MADKYVEIVFGDNFWLKRYATYSESEAKERGHGDPNSKWRQKSLQDSHTLLYSTVD